MGRNRTVGVGTVRLYIADVYRRALADLTDPVKQQALKPADRATPEALALAAASLVEAEADAEWITVKGQLNAGERQRMWSGMYKEQYVGEKAALDHQKFGVTPIMEYLLGWSFVQDDGQPLPLNARQDEPDRMERASQINAVDDETFDELKAAIDWHIGQLEAAKAARKNARAGTPPSAAISASPSDAAGASSGSVS
jgi:hypothetical protein